MARTMTMAEANQIAQQRIEELERELLKYKDGQFFERYERLESQLQALREARKQDCIAFAQWFRQGANRNGRTEDECYALWATLEGSNDR